MESEIKNLDDLVFKNRNKNYGAYANRKNYSRYMIWAMITAISIFLMGISVPLIAGYMDRLNGDKGPLVYISDTLQVIKDPVKKIELPKLEKQRITEPVFHPPVVVADTNQVTPDLADLNDKGTNKPITDSAVTGVREVVDKTPPVIETKPEETYIDVKEMPEFPGGEKGIREYIKDNIVYPEQAKIANITGNVYVTWVVDKTGQVVDAGVLRGIGGGCDEEALRVIRSMPRWKPGRNNGIEVRVKYNMAMNFKLE